MACDHLLVSKMPKKRRKNEENRLFFPKSGFRRVGRVVQLDCAILWDFVHPAITQQLPWAFNFFAYRLFYFFNIGRVSDVMNAEKRHSPTESS